MLIVPGALIPEIEGPGSLSQKLRDAYRLEHIHVETQAVKFMAVETEIDVPSPAPGLDIGMGLLGYNDSVATYRVRMTHDGELLADSPISVRRGGQAIIGSKDGEEAPYIFLVIGTAEEKRKIKDGVAEPKILERLAPKYPIEARKAGIQGTVVLRTIVGKDGSCRVVEIVESPDPVLSDAAREAVEQWSYDPARNEAGEPVQVELKLSVSFRLE